MRLTYSNHALERMDEREIMEADIVQLIRTCPKPRRDIDDNPTYYGLIRGWSVQVVIAQGSQPQRVISVKVTK